MRKWTKRGNVKSFTQLKIVIIMTFVIHSSIYTATEVGQNLSLPCRLGQVETRQYRQAQWESVGKGCCCPAHVAVKVFQDNGLSLCGDWQVRIDQQTSRLPSNLGRGTSNSWLLLCFLPPHSTQVFPPALPTSEAWSVFYLIRHFSDKHYLHNNKSADLIRSSSDREQITATNAFHK